MPSGEDSGSQFALWQQCRDYLCDKYSRAMGAIGRSGRTQIVFWLLALLIGTAAGFGALGFRMGIAAIETFVYGADDLRLATVAAGLPWYWLVDRKSVV